MVKIEDSFKIAKIGGVKLYGLGGNCQAVIVAATTVKTLSRMKGENKE